MNSISSTIVSIFLSIFVWQKTGDINFIYLYFLGLFVSIPFFGIIGAIISEKVNFKLPFLISFLTQVIFLYFVVNKSDFLIANPVAFGILNSIAIGFFAIPRNSLYQILNKENISGGNAVLSVIYSIVGLAVPLAGSYWLAQTGNYKLIFLIAGLSILVCAVLLFFIKLPKSDGKYELSLVLKFLRVGDYRKIIFLRFIDGFKNGIEWGLFGIIMFNLTNGDISKWGYLNFATSGVAIFAGILYSKFIANKYELPTLYIFSILYTFFGLFMLINFNLINFLVYFIGTAISGVFISSSVSKLWSDVFSTSGGNEYSSSEFFSFLELPVMIGRVIPFAILYIYNYDLDSKLVLGVLILFISIIPLISTYILEKTHVFGIKN